LSVSGPSNLSSASTSWITLYTAIIQIIIYVIVINNKESGHMSLNRRA
jgi:hypothetical protein